MEELSKLSTHHCVLLAAQYAAESNITALRTLTALRQDDLEFGLILRLLLTFLPEALEPSQYVEYLGELATGSRTSTDTTLDTTAIHQLSQAQARKRARRLHVLLQPLAHPLYEVESELDPFSHFLINRSHRIDAETGILEFVPQLVAPFLHHSDYLRRWFISTALPLLRIAYEYYPNDPAPSLEKFAQWKGKPAIEGMLSYLRKGSGLGGNTPEIARDLRGIVGPWICGSPDRQRRSSDSGGRRASIDQFQPQKTDDWECLFDWLVQTSKEDFALACSALTDWDGPNDMDLGGYDEGQVYIEEQRQGQLERRYAQVALAILYLACGSKIETIQTAHSLLTRLCNLLGFDPPPQLTMAVESLPRYRTTSPLPQESTTSVLQEENLLQPDNPVTQPEESPVRLLEHFIFSAYLLLNLHYPVSVRDVARMYLRGDATEQFSLLQKLLHLLTTTAKKDATNWKAIRSTLLWLWNWGSSGHEDGGRAQGILGKIDKKALEAEILKALLESNHFPLAWQTYIQVPSEVSPLPLADVEMVILGAAMHHYDNASNGNRTRGGMKRASDIVASFKNHFPSSPRFQRAEALLSATHAMSFYSLTLQHGVPFTPVNIRVSSDPLSLLEKLLSQNRSSYTHLDDLIFIGQNLVISRPSTLMDKDEEDEEMDTKAIEKKKSITERRVISMAIGAALDNDDFETAYSYVVNRLSPPADSPAVSPALSMSHYRLSIGSYFPEPDSPEVDDISWRAALRAGRYQPSMSASANWSGSAAGRDLRWLDQRMELLSQALLLAPPSRLEEVLTEWQQVEKETEKILSEEAEAEERFNDMADRRMAGAFDFEEPSTVQPRRHFGRGAVEEAPMGLFDVARGAAAAFSKTAFPFGGRAAGRGGQHAEAPRDTGSMEGSRVSMDLGSESGSIGGGGDRARKRDMVASAVTGGLASGIGWVLGMYPYSPPERSFCRGVLRLIDDF
jgi:hypothetical protein